MLNKYYEVKQQEKNCRELLVSPIYFYVNSFPCHILLKQLGIYNIANIKVWSLLILTAEKNSSKYTCKETKALFKMRQVNTWTALSTMFRERFITSWARSQIIEKHIPRLANQVPYWLIFCTQKWSKCTEVHYFMVGDTDKSLYYKNMPKTKTQVFKKLLTSCNDKLTGSLMGDSSWEREHSY